MAEKKRTKKNLAGEKQEDKNKSKYNKQIYWLLGTIIIVLMVFFGAYYLFSSLNKFRYEGLTFTKEKFGDIPIFHHYYLFNSQGKLYEYNLYLRNDPRKNNVPITGKAVENDIEFSQNNFVYISLAPEGLVGCEYASVGLANLASFLADNQLNVKGAAPDEELARQNNVRYATCDTNPDDMVIIVKGGNETKIIQEGDNCQIIEIANCEVLPAVEKFQVKTILDARARRARQTQS